jgi:NADH:ubiquinone oxidoreductase subunit 5 (subunit L)/multisubunit Na+/H+ antiporter MnhA subunit
MGSLFGKEPPPPEPTVFERIGPEITHLKNKTSVRDGKGRRRMPWTLTVLLCALLVLYVMDPFLYAWYKYEAVRTYLYLHNYDSPAATRALIETGIFTPEEVSTMNNKQGSYQDYFSSPQEARQRAASIVSYMNGVKDLHAGRYEQLHLVGKIRYTLFVSTGLVLPTYWDFLTPSVN